MPCFIVIVVFMFQRASKNTILTRLSKKFLLGWRKRRSRMAFGSRGGVTLGGQAGLMNAERRVPLCATAAFPL